MTNNEKLKALRGYHKEHKVLPSYAAIAKLIGVKSKNSVFEFVELLKQGDYLALTPEGKIKPGVNFRKAIK